jgi:hypothetical protein
MRSPASMASPSFLSQLTSVPTLIVSLNFGISITLPVIGTFMDLDSSGGEILRYMAVMPAILIFAFLFLNIYFRKK